MLTEERSSTHETTPTPICADGGPGVELLGSPATDLDLGPAEGGNAAFLARTGVEVTAVDFSAVQVDRARLLWVGEPRLTFVHAEACAFLDEDPCRFDAIYSTWGAVWFTDPKSCSRAARARRRVRVLAPRAGDRPVRRAGDGREVAGGP
ncbi:class I SAM-dependent methyltransferase [Streptomyces sp. NPDC018338]|uniref:class I SAM-dependent methyltransferase n=1 Tax=Streptomyces sp. NPDC018338 TaxID=3157192 RepID=UPI0033FC6C4C